MFRTQMHVAQAIASIREYNEAFKRGEEPEFPQWADDLLRQHAAEIASNKIIEKAME